MSAYTLTHTEAWALALLLQLPVQPGSALADWLTSAEMPAIEALQGAAFDGLAGKGYYAPQTAAPQKAHFNPGLLRALTLTAINAATVTTLIRADGKAGLARWAQAGESLVQYGMDEGGFTLHEVARLPQVAQSLLPAWFTVSRNEGLRDTLPLEALLLFNHACVLADWAWARSDLQSEVFSRDELFATFEQSAGWVDIFNAAGMASVPPLEQWSLPAALERLLARGFLAAAGPVHLAVGQAGNPLAEVLSAADRCSLTVTLQTWEDPAALCGAFVHGNGRLFLLEFAPGQVGIQQLGGVENGRAWIGALLNQGRQAHYVDYALPGADGITAAASYRVKTRPPALVTPALAPAVTPPPGGGPPLPGGGPPLPGGGPPLPGGGPPLPVPVVAAAQRPEVIAAPTPPVVLPPGGGPPLPGGGPPLPVAAELPVPVVAAAQRPEGGPPLPASIPVVASPPGGGPPVPGGGPPLPVAVAPSIPVAVAPSIPVAVAPPLPVAVAPSIPEAAAPSVPEPALPERLCPECGVPLEPNQRFCRNCGAKLTPVSAPEVAPPAPARVSQSAPTVRGVILPPPARLRVASGAQSGQEFAVGAQLTVGREADNDVALLDPKVSRHHALIRRDGERFVLADLGSSNGTFVNGERIAAPAALEDGDVIVIGDVELVFGRV